jgi:sugar phosphate isomerase/epimerase
MSQWEIGVFASVDAGLGVRLDVAQELGIPTCHLHCPHPENRTEAAAKSFLEKAKAAGVRVTVVFSGFAGETYESIQRTAETVGLVPEATRAARAAEFLSVSDFAKWIGCDVVALHIGFVPPRGSDSYRDLIQTTQKILDYVKKNGQNLHLETGQESADHLLEFIGDVGRDNLFINFDPANMILYGTGDPIEALRKVGHLVRSIHCKDATWAAEGVRGKEWGCEMPLGEGHVGMETYLRTLKEIGYTGPLTIEREIPHDRERQKADIHKAQKLLEELRAKIL